MPTITQILQDVKTRYRHIYSDAIAIGWLDIVHQKLWNMVPRDTQPITIPLNGSGQYTLPNGIKRRHIKEVTMGPTIGPFTTLDYRDLYESGVGYGILGNVLQIVEPLIVAPSVAPTLTTSTTGGSLAAATHFVVYTWINSNGESVISPEASIVTTGATSTITVTLPTLPTGVTSVGIYISTTSGTQTRQGTTLTTTYTQTTALVTGTAKPVVKILKVYYDKKIPTSLASVATTEKPELDENYHELLTLGLLEMIAAARKDTKMKNNYSSEFNLLLNDYMIESIDDEPDYPSCKDDLPRRARYGRPVGD